MHKLIYNYKNNAKNKPFFIFLSLMQIQYYLKNKKIEIKLK